jgi:hypothetical protein
MNLFNTFISKTLFHLMLSCARRQLALPLPAVRREAVYEALQNP